MSTSNGSVLFRGKVSKAALVRQIYAEARAAGHAPTVAALLPLVQARMKTFSADQRSDVKIADVAQAIANLSRTQKGPLPVAAPAEAKLDRLAGTLDAPSADSRLIPELRLAVRYLADMGGDQDKAAARLADAAYIVGNIKPV